MRFSPTCTARLGRGFVFLPLLAALAVAQSRLPTQRVTNEPVPIATGGFGERVYGLEDLDGDGWADYAVLAPSYPPFGSARGRIYVHSGRTGLAFLTCDSPQAGSLFGRALCSAGDLSGDGVPDLVIGSPGHDLPGAPDAGRVASYSGADGALLWARDGDVAGGALGAAVEAAGPGATTFLVAGEPGRAASGFAGAGSIAYLDPLTGMLLDREAGPVGFDGLGRTLGVRRGQAGLWAGSGGGRVWVLDGPGGSPSASLLLGPLPGSNEAPSLAVLANPAPVGGGLVVGRRLTDLPGLPNAGQVSFFPVGATAPAATFSGGFLNESLGGQVVAIPDQDGDGAEEIGIRSAPAQGLGTRFRVRTLAGQDLDDVSHPHGGVHYAGLPDVTGDGRGEWIAGVATGTAVIYEAQLFTAGLSSPVLAPSLPGGPQVLVQEIDLGPINSQLAYLVAYSATGTAPPLLLGGMAPSVPLVLDAFTLFALEQAGGPILPDALGFLDPQGRATSSITLPAPLATALAGTVVFDVALALAPNGVVATSNPREVLLP